MKKKNLLLICLLCTVLLPLRATALSGDMAQVARPYGSSHSPQGSQKPHTDTVSTTAARSAPGTLPDDEAARFGRLLVQTPQGRIEPVNTYASELLRKLTHRNRYEGISPEAFLLGVIGDPVHWSREPLIYLPDRGVRSLLNEKRRNGENQIPGDPTAENFPAAHRKIRPDNQKNSPYNTQEVVPEKYAALQEFFGPRGEYLLGKAVETAYAKPPGERNKHDKELLKTDEKVNILYSLLSGRMLAMFPARAALPGNTPSDTAMFADTSALHPTSLPIATPPDHVTASHIPASSHTGISPLPAAESLRFRPASDTTWRWYSPGDELSGLKRDDSLFIAKVLPAYASAVAAGSPAPDRERLLSMIETYQQARTQSLGISPKRIGAEIFYNRAGIFRTAFRAYLILGLLLLAALLWPRGSTPSASEISSRTTAPLSRTPSALTRNTSSAATSRTTTSRAARLGNLAARLLPLLLTGLIVAVFLWHTFGLGLRWYISGRAPWTNAYESMVYVGWTTVLAGLLFARRSRLTLALATLMGGVTLFVSNLNWLDPQITPLVPVLKSYWLMIHVSVITASYGFFGICAATGLASLIGILIGRTRRELRIIGELSMIIGLVLLAAGIFLGAVWANESWGRYWGWDPKETWALITLLVYTFVTHARHIPRLNNDFAFSALSVAAIGSVLMTFFGVNYYLSGLHSYGGSGEVAFAPVVGGTLAVAALILAASIRYARSHHSRSNHPRSGKRH